MSLLADLRYRLAYERGHFRLPWRRIRGALPVGPDTAERTRESMRTRGIECTSLPISVAEFHEYVRNADYSRFREYVDATWATLGEKQLEHFVAATLLALQPGRRYLDVASDRSPAPEVYRRLFGVESLRQDLRYPAGLHGDRIGSDAAAIPLPAASIDAIGLHCSFEHFEGDSDTRFIRECGRLLRPGGRVCILPLYMHAEAAVLTDPAVYTSVDAPLFDSDARIYSRAWYGERHGRYYSAETLQARVLDHRGSLSATLYEIPNATDAGSDCYLRFALLLEQPPLTV